MNDTDLRILEMYYGGMDVEVIADELRLPVATVKEVIKAWKNGEYKTR
jgi:DNA-binding NarL/FixJ family response regulator